MEIISLIELALAVYREIELSNTSYSLGKDVVPLSDKFVPYLEKKLNLAPEKIPILFEILAKSKMIFSFPINEPKNKEDEIRGLVIAKGPIIISVRKKCDEVFEKLYTHEFNRKVPIEKLLVEFSSVKKDFENTPLGIAANISSMLLHSQNTLERNILQYSEKITTKLLSTELEKCDPLETFFKHSAKDNKPDMNASKKAPAVKQIKTAESQKKGSIDTLQPNDVLNPAKNNSIEKTLKLYGVEFYTRLCFRDYQFSVMQKIVEEGMISKENDLKAVKTLLDKARQNSDNDVKINDYAKEINELLKTINLKLKSFQ